MPAVTRSRSKSAAITAPTAPTPSKKRNKAQSSSSSSSSSARHSKRTRSTTESEPQHAREQEGQQTETPSVRDGVENWAPGQVDLRTRAPLLLRMLGQLYRFRWNQERNDRFKMIHWQRVANFLEEYEHPVKTLEDIEELGSYRGIGPSTLSVLREIHETGYLDWMDDLLLEVQEIVENRGIADRVIAFNQLRENAEQLGERNAERRAALRRTLVERSRRDGPPEAKYLERVQNAMNNAVIISGAQRRKLWEIQQAKAAEKIDQREEEEEQEDNGPRIVTRGASKMITLKRALHAAVNTDSCAVCLADYEDEDKLAVYECDHCFHMDCIQHWLQSRMANGVQPSCPLCRRPIKVK